MVIALLKSLRDQSREIEEAPGGRGGRGGGRRRKEEEDDPNNCHGMNKMPVSWGLVRRPSFS